MNIQPLTPQSAGITGPMNINAVITHLIEMTPSQRKQFAQIHMDDPMMLSAAKFVDNQVNKQAQSLANQQTGAAPPPVNQQAVAQMSGSPMPEDTGIAQLPAENMPQEYAGGGIVAFADRGLVDTSPQYVGVGGGQGRRGAPIERPPVARQPVQRTAPPPAFQEAPYVPQEKGDFGAMLQSAKTSQGPVVDPYAEQGAEIGRSRLAIANKDKEMAKEREQGIEALLGKKEERVAEREERLKGQEGMNLNMSLINAGLAMMQSTGKGLAGIAEGAQKGVGQYTEGLRLSEASRQKIEDARDAHDDLRFNLKNMSSKEIQAAENAIEQAKITTTLEGISRLEKAFDISHKDAIAVYGAEMTERTAESNRAYQANEARTGRAFSASQDALKMAQTERLNALSIAASSGNAAASRELQRELAKAPGQTEQFVERLATNPTLQRGYEMYTAERGAGRTDKAVLDVAKDIVANALTKEQKSSPEYIAAQQVILNSLGGSRLNNLPILDSSKVNGPILQKPQR
jgi:hypothetical protein